MTLLPYWIGRLLRDIIAMAFVNRAYGMSLAILILLLLGALFSAAQVSAPFIYTLF